MRTALVLLFLLAVAALPGALLPQRSLNQRLVAQYFADHPTLAPLLDRPAVLRRLRRALVRRGLPAADGLAGRLPAAAHRRAGARPAHPAGRHPAQPRPAARTPPRQTARRAGRARSRRGCAATAARLAGGVARRARPGRRVRTVSAERGQLREVGNLVFHLSLLGLLVAFAAGKIVRLRGPGHRAVRRRPVLQHRHPRLRLLPRRPARRRHGPAAVLRARRRLHRHLRAQRPARELHRRRRLPDRRRTSPRAPTRGGPRPSRSTTRCAPTAAGSTCSATATPPASPSPIPDGQQRTGEVQWRPVDQTTLLSEGATKFARPGVTDERAAPHQPARRHRPAGAHQLGRRRSSPRCSRRWTTPRSPSTCCAATSGWTTAAGSRSSRSTGAGSTPATLTRVARENMRPGDEITLDDGTRVRFDGVRDWVSLQVSHDPAQGWVLGFARSSCWPG